MEPPDLRAALRRRFGYPGFRVGQESLVRAVLSGRDALGVLPTGGGKSVCYMLPAGLLPGLVLVISPLVSLMEDQVARARTAGLRAEALHAALPPARQRGVLEELRGHRLDLLLVAPERFGVPAFRRALNAVSVSLMAVDEAHCIAQWGHDFRPSYLALGSVRRSVRAPCLALTATATPRVRSEIEDVLGLRAPRRVVGSFDRANLRWGVLRVRNGRGRDRALMGLLRPLARSGRGSAIVYVSTRRRAEIVRDRIARLGLRVETYHAGMRDEGRSRVQAAFMDGELRTVVATNAFGMGVDKPDVRLVVHDAAPGSLEAYYQEAGRAGRDGEASHCVALYAPGDLELQRAFLDRSRPSVGALRRFLSGLREELAGEGRGDVELGALSRRLGRGWSVERSEAALRFLSGVGLLRFQGAASGTPRPREGSLQASVSLRPGRPRFGRARILRRAGLARLKAVHRYVLGRRCRRRSLLSYFGEDSPEGPCGGCDRCGAALCGTGGPG
jgi:ATP-dependent DNA helicase RecQ